MDELASSYISSRTRRGIQILPIEEVFYFKAEHKYIIAYHQNGELLLDTTLSKLENLYSAKFIRIHRHTIIAKNKIDKIEKISTNKYILKLRGREELLSVSRRTMPKLRQYIKSITNG